MKAHKESLKYKHARVAYNTLFYGGCISIEREMMNFKQFVHYKYWKRYKRKDIKNFITTQGIYGFNHKRKRKRL